MLKLFRNKQVTKVILWLILILILPAFVVVGYMSTDRNNKKGPTYAGLIDKKKVSFDDFAQSISSIRCQVVLNYFNNTAALDMLLKNKAFVGKLAWDRLIMLQKAKAMKIKIADSDVVKFITTHPLFLRNGKFDDRIYQYFLTNSLGIYPRNFEEVVRENLMIQKLTDTVTKDVKVSDDEIARDYEKNNSKFKISYVYIPLTDFTGKVAVPDDKALEFYEKHKQEFVIQAKDIDGKETSKTIATFDEAKEVIKSLLAENEARPMAMESATGTYNKIREVMAKDKLSFEAAASKLGLKTQEPKPLMKSDSLEGVGEANLIAMTAAGMKKGEISKPIDTRKGIMIFKLTEIQPFDQEAFKKDKDSYSKKVLAEKKNVYMEDWLRQLEKSAELKIDLQEYESYYK